MAQQPDLLKKSGKKKKKKNFEKEQPVTYSFLYKGMLKVMTYLDVASL